MCLVRRTLLPDLTCGYGFATVLGQDKLFLSCCDKKGHWCGTFRCALSASGSTSSAASHSEPPTLTNLLNGSQTSALNLYLVVVGDTEHVIRLMTVRVKDCLCLLPRGFNHVRRATVSSSKNVTD